VSDLVSVDEERLMDRYGNVVHLCRSTVSYYLCECASFVSALIRLSADE
jgi:hypothetical protein